MGRRSFPAPIRVPSLLRAWSGPPPNHPGAHTSLAYHSSGSGTSFFPFREFSSHLISSHFSSCRTVLVLPFNPTFVFVRISRCQCLVHPTGILLLLLSLLQYRTYPQSLIWYSPKPAEIWRVCAQEGSRLVLASVVDYLHAFSCC